MQKAGLGLSGNAIALCNLTIAAGLMDDILQHSTKMFLNGGKTYFPGGQQPLTTRRERWAMDKYPSTAQPEPLDDRKNPNIFPCNASALLLYCN